MSAKTRVEKAKVLVVGRIGPLLAGRVAQLPGGHREMSVYRLNPYAGTSLVPAFLWA
jgi:hypothetical protein